MVRKQTKPWWPTKEELRESWKKLSKREREVVGEADDYDWDKPIRGDVEPQVKK
jgi:hypothetical protein